MKNSQKEALNSSERGQNEVRRSICDMYQHPYEWVLGEVLQKSFRHPSHLLKSIRLLYRYVTRDELVAAMERVSQGLREEIRSSFNSIGKLALCNLSGFSIWQTTLP